MALKDWIQGWSVGQYVVTTIGSLVVGWFLDLAADWLHMVRAPEAAQPSGVTLPPALPGRVVAVVSLPRCCPYGYVHVPL
jgi:hypothetical protein